MQGKEFFSLSSKIRQAGLDNCQQHFGDGQTIQIDYFKDKYSWTSPMQQCPLDHTKMFSVKMEII